MIVQCKQDRTAALSNSTGTWDIFNWNMYRMIQQRISRDTILIHIPDGLYFFFAKHVSIQLQYCSPSFLRAHKASS